MWSSCGLSLARGQSWQTASTLPRSNQRPNKRLQLALQPFAERPLICDKVRSLQLVRSRFGLCSVDPGAPQGATEAQSR